MKPAVARGGVLMASCIALCVALVAAGTRHVAPERTSPPAAAGFREAMHEAMQSMMRDMHAPHSSGNADIDFLAMMIPHHAGAIDMARLVLEHGRDPATRRLAEEIIAGQAAEIESMQRRLAMLRDAGRVSTFPELGGTRGP